MKKILLSSVMRKLFLASFLLVSGFASYAQEENTTLNKQQAAAESDKWGTVRFSNSEDPNLSFMVNTNMQQCLLYITTNYTEQFTIRFINYWGKSVRVYRHIQSGTEINVAEFKDKIMIFNIVEEKSNRLLSSQVVNLKRRNYWKEEV